MQIEKNDIISYEEALELLGCKTQTLRNGVSRGILTPLPRRARKPGRLARQQVELFIEKDLTLRALSPQEAVIWQEVHNAIKHTGVKHNVMPIELVPDQVAFIGALIEGIADIALEVAESVIDDAQKGNFTPENMLLHVRHSPSFLRIASLFGVNLETMPDETAQAINKMAYEVVEKVQAKFFSLLLKYATRNMMIESQDDQEHATHTVLRASS